MNDLPFGFTLSDPCVSCKHFEPFHYFPAPAYSQPWCKKYNQIISHCYYLDQKTRNIEDVILRPGKCEEKNSYEIKTINDFIKEV